MAFYRAKPGSPSFSPTTIEQTKSTELLTKDGSAVALDTAVSYSLSDEVKHEDLIMGIDINGTRRNRRGTGANIGLCVDVGGGYIAVSVPGDKWRGSSAGSGSVWTYDYDGNFYRRYVNLGDYGRTTHDSTFGRSLAITDANELAIGQYAWNSNNHGRAYKTMMWREDCADRPSVLNATPDPSEFSGSSFESGISDYLDNLYYSSNHKFFQKVTPYRYASYDPNATDTEDTALGDYIEIPEYEAAFPESGGEVTPNLSSMQYWEGTSPAQYQEFGRGIAAGCGRIVVTGKRGASDNYFFSLFDDRGIKLRDVASPRIDERWGQSSNKVSIGSGRICVASDDSLSTGNVYVFDLNGNYLFELREADAGVSSHVFASSVAVGCGRIVVSSWPVSTSSRTGANEMIHIFDLNGHFIKSVNRADAHDGGFESNGFTMDDSRTGSGFGFSLDIGSGLIAVGAPYYDWGGNNPTDSTGAVFLLDIDGNPIQGWTILGHSIACSRSSLLFDQTQDYAFYGYSVAVDDGVIVAGAPFQKSATGSHNDNGAFTISHYRVPGLDRNVEKMLRGLKRQSPMRHAETLAHARVRDFW